MRVFTSTEVASLKKRKEQLARLIFENATPYMTQVYQTEMAEIDTRLRYNERYAEFLRKGFRVLEGGKDTDLAHTPDKNVGA